MKREEEKNKQEKQATHKVCAQQAIHLILSNIIMYRIYLSKYNQRFKQE